MKPHRAQHSIQLSVSQLAVTEAFYGGILELPVQRPLTTVGAPDHLLIDLDGLAIIFVEEDDVLRSHPVLESRYGMFPRGVGMTLHFEVKDIAGIRDALLEEGVEILYPLEVKPYGIKEMWCFDPDGYLVVLDEPLSAT